jgi:hypothetical protein
VLIPGKPKRVVHRIFELLVGAALLALVVTFFVPGKAGLLYFLGAMVLLFFVLHLLRKWPSI